MGAFFLLLEDRRRIKGIGKMGYLCLKFHSDKIALLYSVQLFRQDVLYN